MYFNWTFDGNNVINPDKLKGALTQNNTNERSVYYKNCSTGNDLYVAGYVSGILCVHQNGVGCSVFAFTTSGSGDGFAVLTLLAGSDIASYITRTNSAVHVDSGNMTIIKSS